MNRQNKALLRPGNLVQVYWLDIMGFTNECLKHAKPAPCYSVGHVRRISRELGPTLIILATMLETWMTIGCTTPAYQLQILGPSTPTPQPDTE